MRIAANLNGGHRILYAAVTANDHRQSTVRRAQFSIAAIAIVWFTLLCPASYSTQKWPEKILSAGIVVGDVTTSMISPTVVFGGIEELIVQYGNPAAVPLLSTAPVVEFVMTA
jgi:hypothetical protein